MERHGTVDALACMGKLQYAFESEAFANNFFANAAKLVRGGGYFFGHMPDMSSVWSAGGGS